MFFDLPQAIANRMRYLEGIDARDRTDGTPSPKRLRQIGPQTARFMAIMAALAPEGTYLEIGTSAGYSSLWLALACLELGRKITTFEISHEKVSLARETSVKAGIDGVVQCVAGDALKFLGGYADISFCFLDSDKSVYSDCYEALVPRMIKGGILLADNVISHGDILDSFLAGAKADQRMDCVVVPIESGILLCRKV